MGKIDRQTISGFVDLQVNGYKGVDFSSAELTEGSFTYACHEYLKTGTAMFLPTVITSTESIFERNLKLMAKCISKAPLDRHIPGIHLEGPFLSPEEGAVGAHDPKYIKKPCLKFFDKLMAWSGNKIRILTMAAEVENAAELCHHAVQKGVVVSLGHQLASVGQMTALAGAGASLLTHLGNGMPAKVDRHDNPLLAGLAVDKLNAMVITDGHHIPAHLIGIILKLKGPDSVLVTSDASPVAGLPPGTYNTLGNKVVLSPTGCLYNPDTGYMVGSSNNMLDCMNHLASLDLLDLHQLLKVGVENPLKCLGMDMGSFVPSDLAPKVRVDVSGGKIIFSPIFY